MTTNIVFIDSRVADYETLITGLGVDTRWFLIGAEQDGVAQMQSILENYSSLDSIQVISHGSEGALYLGSTVLTSDNLSSYASQLQAIGSSLTETGDILLYGCNVAQGDVGISFVNALAELTGADVAASDDRTGGGTQPGDWVLERATGSIESEIAFDAATLASYDHTLIATVFDFESCSDQGSIVTQPGTGVTLTVSSTSGGGVSPIDTTGMISGMNGYAIGDDWASSKSMTFSFSTPVNIASLKAAEGSSLATTFVFTPAGGSNSSVTQAINGSNATSVNLNWVGVTSFTVTTEMGQPVDFLIDDITLVNAAPTLSATGGVHSFTEGGNPTDLFSAVTAATRDSDQSFSGMTLTVSNVSDGSKEILSIGGADIALTNANSGAISGIGNYSVSLSGSIATVTLTGMSRNDTQMGTLIDGVTYRNTSDDPTAISSSRGVTITQVVDSGNSTNSTSPNIAATVNLTPVNDAPTLTAAGATTTFNYGVNTSGVDLFSGVSINTVESLQSISRLSLTVSNVTDGIYESLSLGSFGKILLIDGAHGTISTTGPSSYTRSYAVSVDSNTHTATVTLSMTESAGTSNTSLVASWIDGITYSNGSPNPTTANPRVITVSQLQDSGGIANGGQDMSIPGIVATVTVETPPQGPTVSNLANDSSIFQLGSSTAVKLDAGTAASVSDPDSTHFNGGSLVFSPITPPGFVTAQGDFSVDGTIVQSGGDATFTAGETVTVNGNAIGVVALNKVGPVTLDGQDGAALRIDFTTAYATPAAISTLLQNLYYLEDTASNTSGSRAFSYTLDDGPASPSTTVGTVVLKSNSAPEFTSGGTGTVAENSETTIVIYDADATDQDSGTMLAYTLSGTDADQLNIDSSSGEVTLKTSADYETKASYDFSVVASDGSLSTTKVVSVSVTNVNEAPTISAAGTTRYIEQTPVAVSENITISDVDGDADWSGGTLEVSNISGSYSLAETLYLPTSNTVGIWIDKDNGNALMNGNIQIGTANTDAVHGGPLTLTFNADATSALVQETARAVLYNYDNDEPQSADRKINFTVENRGGLSSSYDQILEVAVVNDAPVLTATGASVTFNLDTDFDGVDLFSSVSINTIENIQSISELTLTVTNVYDGFFESMNFGLSQVQLVDGNTGYQSAYTSDGELIYSRTYAVSVDSVTHTATVTLSLAESAGNVNSLILTDWLEGLTYRNSSLNPTVGERVVTITQLQDNGGTANGGLDTSTPNIATTVTVQTPAQTPVISNFDGDTQVAELGSSTPVRLDTGVLVNVTDADSPNFDGGTLTLSFSDMQQLIYPDNPESMTRDEIAAYLNDPNHWRSPILGQGSFSFDGTLVKAGTDGVISINEEVTVGGTVIATVALVDLGGERGSDLQLTFNDQATPERVATLLHNLHYLEDTSAAAGVRLIQFALSDGSSHGLERGMLSFTVDTPPTLPPPTVVSYTDTVSADTFATTTGTLVGTDVDTGTTLTYDILGSTIANGVSSKSGVYGTLSVNNTTGAYTYTPSNAAIEEIKTNTSESFTVTVSDGAITTTANFQVNLTGANDPTSFGGTSTGAVLEDANVTVDGKLTVSDRDAGDANIITQTDTAGIYGSISIDTNGAWTYTLANNTNNVDALIAGQKVSDTFSVTTVGGATKNIVITINGANDTPTASNRTVTFNEDTTKSFAVADFGFADVDTGSALASITITTLETNGALKYNDGTSLVDVTLNQVITAADISAGKLLFTPAANANGRAYTSFGFTVSDGTTTSSSSYTMTMNVMAVNDAPSGSIIITGAATQGQILTASNNLTDVDGLGTISYQWSANGTAISGATASTYMLTSGEVGKTLTVKASYTDQQGMIESKTSGVTQVILNGFISGTGGNDTLMGSYAADSMAGQAGNDLYYVNHLSDVVSEAAGAGTDTVYSYLKHTSGQTYTLSANIENGRILAAASSNLAGNELANTLYAGTGNNVIDGDAGTDTVSYLYGLVAGATSGVTANLSTGVVTGNSGSDTLTDIENLTGSRLTDTLIGSAGANILRGGAGADVLIGNNGWDAYYIDNFGDVVTETNATASTGGTDTVYSYLTHTSGQTYTLGANIENGRILAAASSNLTGNELANMLYAGTGNNVIDGAAGTDTVSYLYGLVAGATSGVTANLSTGVVTGSSGTDTLTNLENLTGSSLADTLIGTTGANILTGGAGKDILVGNGGNDIFDFNALSASGITNTTWDMITDFNLGDKIDLSTLDANASTTSVNEAFTKITVGGAFNGTFGTGASTLYFDAVNHVLYGNTNADGAAEFAIQLSGVNSLSITDFVL